MVSNAPYNGYSWQQRARIMPAYRKLTGRRSPFDGEPCAMCGDPDRPPNEWHSEDYSEPFGFQPPQSYPLCKPCHSRLHKRFNAPDGEWELFCLHLEAGGYGSEFVKLRSRDERRALCQRLATGERVELPPLRRRKRCAGDDWWRTLTLDPESLLASWARPRPLRPRPESAEFLHAFESLPLSTSQTRLLQAHAAAPRRTATMRHLAKAALESDSPKTANLLYGGLARQLTALLDWEPDSRKDGSPIWMSLFGEGWWPPSREFEWTMAPSAAEAVGFRSTKEKQNKMEATCKLPEHGRIACSLCHRPQTYNFDRTRTERDGWRITNNPLAWGGREPEVIVLGFSKGPTQAGALASSPHEAIAYKGGRTAIAKILHHVGLLQQPDSRLVDRLISDRNGPIHFGSLIRCTVERRDEAGLTWKGTGGGMLDRFVATEFGSSVARRCASTFLGRLPERTRLILMLGLGSKLKYVQTCMKLFAEARPGTWKRMNDVAYTDGKVVVVHTEHFASQGALLPNWLSGEDTGRGRYGLLAKEAVVASGATRHLETPRGDPRQATEMADSIARASTTVRSAAAVGSTVRPRATRSPVGHAIVLTDGAIRNGNLSLNSVRHLIPAGGVGGTSKSDLGRPFNVRFDPGDVHETDVPGDKMILRCRGAVRDFFVRTDARGGDVVRIVPEDNRTLAITLQRR